MDANTLVNEFDVVGIDSDYDFSVEKKRSRKVVRFKAGNDFASKVK
ncbi:MAG TPA: hypothetical protein PKI01_12870 [Bacteroidales bacterium]|nr:hypothetical protein [Bacteroidales bacterium]